MQQLSDGAAEENRKADKLVKVFLKDGTERWLLVHIEVQGYQDANFARRMFTTYYRLLDKFNQPIEALVIYTDKAKKHHYRSYSTKALKTELLYTFNSFEITQYTTSEYEGMDNPLAVIFQTALLGLKSTWKDEKLLQQKTLLFRNLLKKGYPKKRIRVISSFIKTYVNFSKPEYNRKFDERTTLISKNTSNMGILETIQHINEELEAKGIATGKTEAKIEAERKQLTQRIQRIHKALQKKVAISTIALVEDIPIQFVKDFKKQLDSNTLPLLIKDIAKLYRRIKADTPKKAKQQWQVNLWTKYQFTDTAIALLLDIPVHTIPNIRAQK